MPAGYKINSGLAFVHRLSFTLLLGSGLLSSYTYPEIWLIILKQNLLPHLSKSQEEFNYFHISYFMFGGNKTVVSKDGFPNTASLKSLYIVEFMALYTMG